MKDVQVAVGKSLNDMAPFFFRDTSLPCSKGGFNNTLSKVRTLQKSIEILSFSLICSVSSYIVTEDITDRHLDNSHFIQSQLIDRVRLYCLSVQ